ncbi:MAG: dihydrolipoamide acetyltransferase family protein [Paraglaciecola sp.]
MSNYLIEVPDIGEGIAEVELVEWSASVGQKIEEDDVICIVMTDKATVEIPSPVDGEITWQACEPGDMIAVGAEFVKLQVEGEGNYIEGQTSVTNVPETKHTSPSASDAVPKQAEKPREKTLTEARHEKSLASNEFQAAPTRHSSGAPRPEGEKPLASPAVRRRALEAGIKLNYVAGSGPAGLITHEDLDGYIKGESSSVVPQSQSALADHSIEEVKVIGLRRKIAAIMQDTMQRIPHFTYVEEIDVSELERLRSKLNKEKGEEQPKLTMLPFFIKAVVIALRDYPEMNARFDDQKNVVYRYGGAHVGIATQTDSGLVVPVLKHAETHDLWQSANEIKRLSGAARGGTAKPEELTGSSITISSLGPLGGVVTTPVINSPEVAILGINKVSKRPVWQDGGFVPRDMMNISSSFDHRIIDGWEATLFIQRIKSLLESPATLFM